MRSSIVHRPSSSEPGSTIRYVVLSSGEGRRRAIGARGNDDDHATTVPPQHRPSRRLPDAAGPDRRAGAAGPHAVIQELEAASLLRAVFSERQLFEIMVDFWSNHLNIYIGKDQARWFKTTDDRDVIRAHALGSFRDLLLASAK